MCEFELFATVGVQGLQPKGREIITIFRRNVALRAFLPLIDPGQELSG